jgi:hypothetical protein
MGKAKARLSAKNNTEKNKTKKKRKYVKNDNFGKKEK